MQKTLFVIWPEIYFLVLINSASHLAREYFRGIKANGNPEASNKVGCIQFFSRAF